MSRTTCIGIEPDRRSAGESADGVAHGAVRTVPAAEMARMKRATRRDLASMRKHPANPWLDIAIKAKRLEDPVHWRLGTLDNNHGRAASACRARPSRLGTMDSERRGR